MESKHLPSVFQDKHRFEASFKIYAVKIDMLGVYSKWVDRVFDEAVVRVIQAKLDGKEELRVLGVGSGAGEPDYMMLEKVMKRFPRIINRVVEPTTVFLDQYRALAQSKAHKLQGVMCDWRQQTIEQYEKAGDLTKFHFISAVQSLYYVDNPESTLMYMYERLEPGGVMLVAIISEDSGWMRFWNHFPSLHDQLFAGVDSAILKSWLDRRGIPYTRYNQPTHCDITVCFDQSSEEGSLLLDSLTQVLNFRKTVPEDLQTSVMNYLANGKKDGGRVFIEACWEVIVVSKPRQPFGLLEPPTATWPVLWSHKGGPKVADLCKRGSKDAQHSDAADFVCG
ncbi:histamine N-methyltransferase-like [Patiria miniata]|uniref:Histamine N-methyltransferase n=1 Tax=Patiria miniata TaxID=46514 RepID=A0A914BKW2_PATMI|nr:histamine N-methyltransferase-like [Patiria miniata]